MSYYMATICRDRKHNSTQVVVHWDDNDPSRAIGSPIDIDGEVTEETLAEAVASAGWRVTSIASDNIARGWAIVTRANVPRPGWPAWTFYDPITGGFSSSLTEENKREIKAKYPDAVIPGMWP